MPNYNAPLAVSVGLNLLRLGFKALDADSNTQVTVASTLEVADLAPQPFLDNFFGDEWYAVPENQQFIPVYLDGHEKEGEKKDLVDFTNGERAEFIVKGLHKLIRDANQVGIQVAKRAEKEALQKLKNEKEW